MLAAHVTEAPARSAERRAVVPPALSALVMRCLEKRPADRPQTASEMVQALDDITTSPSLRARIPKGAAMLAIVVAALGVAGAYVSKRGSIGSDTGLGPKRVAVLPFENLGDSADAYFAAGITDEIRGKLALLSTMQVTASASADQYRSTTKSPQQIGQELGVDYLLVGKIRWVKAAGGRSRVG